MWLYELDHFINKQAKKTLLVFAFSKNVFYWVILGKLWSRCIAFSFGFFLLCKVHYLDFTLKAKVVLGKADTYIQVTGLGFGLFPKG